MPPAPPTLRPIQLVDRHATPPGPTAAVLVRDYPAALLHPAEAAWGPARRAGAEWAASQGRDVFHWHWDWRNKHDLIAAGERRLVAVEWERAAQGLMALATEHAPALLCPGERVVYVDYLEVAPWNSRELSPHPRFAPVGTVLIREAIWLSLDAGLGGRVGLHSLPNAESFYEHRCGMTRLGPDAAYHDLVYFEYTDTQAAEWLANAGLP